MNRRSFLASAAGLLVASWWPRRKPAIDLAAFCDLAHAFRRYNMARPFVQDGAAGAAGPALYATNARVCLRLPHDYLPTDAPDGKLPPAAELPWQDRTAAGWREWPAQLHLLAGDSTCPQCAGAERVCHCCGEPYDSDKICDCILSDSAKYRLIGNSVAVPVVEWIGRRIVEAICPPQP